MTIGFIFEARGPPSPSTPTFADRTFSILAHEVLPHIILTLSTAGTIGFEQSSYIVREGVDAEAEVCFRILSPLQSQIDPISAFALINIDPFEDTAQGILIVIYIS
jgi:hypothetical protein